MLTIRNGSLYLDGNELLSDINISVNPGDRIGVVGRNGSGKSSLLSLLSGDMRLDSGERILQQGCDVCLIKQNLPDGDLSPLDFLRENDPDLVRLNERLELAQGAEAAEIYEQISNLEVERHETLAPKVLMGLGLKTNELTQPMRILSGGLQMRIGLALSLILSPDILLLDEPTNHLDLEAAEWLIHYLTHYSPKSAVVIVTHDLSLLEGVTNSTLILRSGKVTFFSGTYELYKEQRENLDRADEKRNAQLVKQAERKVEIYYKFRDLPASRAAQAVQQLKAAEALRSKIVNIVEEEPVVDLAFPEPSDLPDPILRLTSVSVGYSERTVLSDVSLSVQAGQKVGLLGKNGEGKSTLLKLFADKIEPQKGEVIRNPRLSVGYFSQELMDELRGELTVFQQFSDKTGIKDEQRIRSLLDKYGFNYEKTNRIVRNLSGGEKARLLFSTICESEKRPHLIILDEPTNHLDVETRNSLVLAMNQFKGAIILVSHDRKLHEQTTSSLWLVKDGWVSVYDKGLSKYRKEIFDSRAGLAESKSKSTSAGSSAMQGGLFSSRVKQRSDVGSLPSSEAASSSMSRERKPGKRL